MEDSVLSCLRLLCSGEDCVVHGVTRIIVPDGHKIAKRAMIVLKDSSKLSSKSHCEATAEVCSIFKLIPELSEKAWSIVFDFPEQSQNLCNALLEKSIPFKKWPGILKLIASSPTSDLCAMIARKQLTNPQFIQDIEIKMRDITMSQNFCFRLLKKSSSGNKVYFQINFDILMFVLKLFPTRPYFEVLSSLIKHTTMFKSMLSSIIQFSGKIGEDKDKFALECSSSPYLIISLFFKMFLESSQASNASKLPGLIDFSRWMSNCTPKNSEIDKITIKYLSSPLIQIAVHCNYDIEILRPYLEIRDSLQNQFVVFDPDLSRHMPLPFSTFSGLCLLKMAATLCPTHAPTSNAAKAPPAASNALELFIQLLNMHIVNPYQVDGSNSHVVAYLSAKPYLMQHVIDWIVDAGIDGYSFDRKRTSKRRPPGLTGLLALLGTNAKPAVVMKYIFHYVHRASQNKKKCQETNMPAAVKESETIVQGAENNNHKNMSNNEDDEKSVVSFINIKNEEKKEKEENNECEEDDHALAYINNDELESNNISLAITNFMSACWPSEIPCVGDKVAPGRSCLVTIAKRCNAKTDEGRAWREVALSILGLDVSPLLNDETSENALQVWVAQGDVSMIQFVFEIMRGHVMKQGFKKGFEYAQKCHETKRVEDIKERNLEIGLNKEAKMDSSFTMQNSMIIVNTSDVPDSVRGQHMIQNVDSNAHAIATKSTENKANEEAEGDFCPSPSRSFVLIQTCGDDINSSFLSNIASKISDVSVKINSKISSPRKDENTKIVVESDLNDGEDFEDGVDNLFPQLMNTKIAKDEDLEFISPDEDVISMDNASKYLLNNQKEEQNENIDNFLNQVEDSSSSSECDGDDNRIDGAHHQRNKNFGGDDDRSSVASVAPCYTDVNDPHSPHFARSTIGDSSTIISESLASYDIVRRPPPNENI